MVDQIRRQVDSGKILNYDACFQNPLTSSLALKNPVPNDDLNMGLAKDKLCRTFFNIHFWRGGVNSSIDDRIKNELTASWDNKTSTKYKSSIDKLQSDFQSNTNDIKQATLSWHLYGQENDNTKISNIKQGIQTSIEKIKKHRTDLNVIGNNIKKQNDTETLQTVSADEENLRRLELENKEFRKIAELRREQAKNLYTRYDGNYHSSVFGYTPIRPSSRVGLMYASFFMGFIGLIGMGILIANILITPPTQSTSSTNSFFSMFSSSKGSTQSQPRVNSVRQSRY